MKKYSLPIFTVIFLLCACGGPQNSTTSKEGYVALDDLYIVDCLLPGQLMRLGDMSYLAPRRPIKTTTQDCRIRGGEYTDYDRADYRSALKVWLPQAKEGDAEAQNYVAEIYEKGVGGTPDYKSAAYWYGKAAEQGNSRALLNLGYLYEQGLGVEANSVLALNYYRQASGAETGQLMFTKDAEAELNKVKDEVAKKLKRSSLQIGLLKQQLQIAQSAAKGTTEENEALQGLYEQSIAEKAKLEEELKSLEVVYRGYSQTPVGPVKPLDEAISRKIKNTNAGRYYALIIGNQDYLHLDNLRSPVLDSQRLKKVLEDKYGFTTRLVLNASEKAILNAINDFYGQITESDNLLIFYAGHGEMSAQGISGKQRGYWLPVDAELSSISSWINNAVISDHLDRLKARSVLVIADSCYAGGLGAEKSPFLFGVSSSAPVSEQALQLQLKRRARVVISSGGDKPVLDGTQTHHSIFTSALVNALEGNHGLLKDSELFSQIAIGLNEKSALIGKPQAPEMKPIREAGHEGGSFYFIPST